MSLTPAQLKQDVELVLHEAEAVLPLLEGLPSPVGAFVAKVATVLKDVDIFLNAPA